MAAFLSEIWIFYESQKAQISARKAAMYSAVMQCFLAVAVSMKMMAHSPKIDDSTTWRCCWCLAQGYQKGKEHGNFACSSRKFLSNTLRISAENMFGHEVISAGVFDWAKTSSWLAGLQFHESIGTKGCRNPFGGYSS